MFELCSRGHFGAALLGLPLCLAGAASADDLPTIRISGPPVDDFKMVYYGMRSGLFHKYGVNVEVIPANSGAAALASVAGGSADVSFGSLPGFLQAHARGVPVLIVAPAGMYLSEEPTNLLLVRRDSPIKTGRDLNNRVIASQALRDLPSVTIMAWMDQNGGDSRTVRAIELPYSAVLPALDEGRIDAACLSSPFLEQALASGKIRVLAKSYDAIAKKFMEAAFVSMADYIAHNKDTMSRFARAMHEAIGYTDAHLPETVDLVASYSGIEPSVIARSIRAVDPEFVEAKNIQPLIDVAFKYKLIDQHFTADQLISSDALRPPR
jgi:NitT/TauT family transport system substrate-binding protein